jgi:dTDP-4-amino-4,6-dideoxygalactose transaminase
MGTWGHLGVLSFNGNKIITTSGGGALLSDDRELIDKSRFLATQARDEAPHYEHSHIGFNYRMSNILAGIGCGQMEVLGSHIEKRRSNNKWYQEILGNTEGINFQKEPNEDYYSNFWLSSINIDPTKCGFTREELRLKFESANIESRPLWKPMHLQPVFKGFPFYSTGVSEKLFENGLCLPSGSNMTSSERDRIERVLSEMLNN